MSGFTDFFQNQQATPPQPLEPAGFDLIRDLLMRKAFGLESNPYGYQATVPSGYSNGLLNAPAFGGGNTPGYPTSTTSSPGWGSTGPRVVNRPVGIGPGARVPINASGTPPQSQLMAMMAGPSASTGNGSIASLLASLGTRGTTFHDGKTCYDGGHGHFHGGRSQPAAPSAQGPLVNTTGGWNPAGSPMSMAGQGGLPALNQSWAQKLGMSGADVMNHWNQLHPNAAPRLFQGGTGHTFETYDSNGNIVPLLEQNGNFGQAGRNFGRPTDPVAAAAYDRLMARNRGHGPVGFGGYSTGYGMHPTNYSWMQPQQPQNTVRTANPPTTETFHPTTLPTR